MEGFINNRRLLCRSTVIVLLFLIQWVSLSTANYAVLTMTINTSLPSNQSEHCTVYNSDSTQLDTKSNPAPSDFLPASYLNMTFDPYGCTNLPDNLVSGRALVVLRGNCTFYEKAYNAQVANVSMLVVVYNESSVSSVPALSGNVTINIPVLMVDNYTGDHILTLLESSPLYLYGYIPPLVTFDPSAVVLMLIAVTTVLLGAYIANTPYEFLRYGLLIHKDSPKGSLSLPEEELNRYTVLGAVIGVLVMVTVVCSLLLLLYFFYYPMVYIALAFYSLAAVIALYYLLSPFVALIPGGDRFRLPPNKIPIFKYRPGPFFFLTLLFSAAIVTWWVIERHAVYAWVIQDVLGFAFIALLFHRLSFVKPWVVALIMCILFFYDIFMVFITPYFTSDGVSVMEKAAVGPAGSTERLPVVFTVMKFIYPTKLDTLCSATRPFSLLGYGDVGIPGLLVTLALKHDFTFRPRKCFRIYFAASAIAYILGLVCTYIALAFMETAQPALLYLVPTTLLSVIIVALIRREVILFFTGKPPKSKASKPCEVKGHATDVHTETECDEDRHNSETDSEKTPLV